MTCTRNAYEEVCAGEVDGKAWQDVAAAVRGEELHVFTGSEVVNQFTRDFFCQAGAEWGAEGRVRKGMCFYACL